MRRRVSFSWPFSCDGKRRGVRTGGGLVQEAELAVLVLCEAQHTHHHNKSQPLHPSKDPLTHRSAMLFSPPWELTALVQALSCSIEGPFVTNCFSTCPGFPVLLRRRTVVLGVSEDAAVEQGAVHVPHHGPDVAGRVLVLLNQTHTHHRESASQHKDTEINQSVASPVSVCL